MEKSLLFGITIGGAAVAALYILSKKKEKTYVEVNKDDPELNEVKEDPTIEEVIEKKVKEAGQKMAEWILGHKDYIEASTAVVGFVASLFSLRNAISPKKTKGMLNLNDKIECDRYFTSVYKDAREDILNDFFDDMFESGGRTLTNSDGKRQLIITARKIGEVA